MATDVTRTVVVRRPVVEVAAFATDPDRLLPIMGGIDRFERVADGEYDVFLDVGTIHIGGRVMLENPAPNTLAWRSVRGTTSTFRLVVEEHPDGSLVTARMTLRLSGLLMARLSEVLGRGIMGRHLTAGLEQLRHHLEHESRA
ncbi:SRPBCC family protein [Nocardioides jensenii]|uniref:SRPBCC family protein n=1 Tax=Nocardioides jensenii TaxID=1843 RepID=UPI00083226BE|nr:SRPBCC family protein [Nocardioides jensenii]